ncbi:LUC7-domain-containing protein [Auricularia subglabra TFB-10046 SS5]|uniref:LUC7-domain-containing protein n=1 Tax=Auricularia subglabra (strain TFB-10046 / SS5) TaxID=717982 RepID=J0LDX2_AURST|nr:LUC7-domain-containing protein [Auricularia subglabra TFB-10046 SS5]
MGRLAEMQRKLLEQMMGPEAMGLAVANFGWEDERTCRNFLCGTCPHILFTNTKMDLGACPKSHTERLRTEYLAAKEKNANDPIFAKIQNEYEQNIFAFVDECDRRIRAAHRRLEKTPEENAKTTNLMREIGEIELAIQGGMEKIETLGEQGKVEESMQEMSAVEALKAEKSEKERELQQLTETSGASGHQKLRVCDVCGAYLSVLDSDRRLADHFGGKMHLGYHELRNLLKKFAEDRAARKTAPLGPPAGVSTVAMGPPSAPTGPRDRDRDHRDSRDHRERERDRGDRDRGDRDRGYDRDRDRDRGYSSRHDSDRRRSDRDRERSRSPRRGSRY